MTTEEKAAAWVFFVDRFRIRWGIMTESTEC